MSQEGFPIGRNPNHIRKPLQIPIPEDVRRRLQVVAVELGYTDREVGKAGYDLLLIGLAQWETAQRS